MLHAEILHRCFRCGYCKMPADYTDINCPSYLANRFESFSPGGRMWLLRGWLEGKLEASPRLAKILFSCATCNNCVMHCAFPGFRDELVQAFNAGKEKLLDAGVAPPLVRDCLTRWQTHGNAYGLSPSRRNEWAEKAGVPVFSGQEWLLWAGDAGSYDSRGKKAAAAAARVLGLAGLDIAVGDGSEAADGNDAAAMGETALFEELCQKNLAAFSRMGVKKILTLSPHAFHAFSRLYPAQGGKLEVFHYTQALAFRMGGLPFDSAAPPVRVAFHDPCYLGRHMGDFESARSVLRQIPGAELLEMDRSRSSALCCGGGGGNVFTDILGGGADAPARVRVREAVDAGAQVLVTACPACAVMLEDAVKAENLLEKIQVAEICELIQQRLSK